MSLNEGKKKKRDTGRSVYSSILSLGSRIEFFGLLVPREKERKTSLGTSIARSAVTQTHAIECIYIYISFASWGGWEGRCLLN